MNTTIIFSQPEPTYPELGIDFSPAWDSSKRLRRMFPDIDIDNPPAGLKRKVARVRREIAQDTRANPRLYLGHCESYCKVEEAEVAQLRRKAAKNGSGRRTTQELYEQYSDRLPAFYYKAFEYIQKRSEQDDMAFLDPRMNRFWRRPYVGEADGFDVCAVEVTREGRTFFFTGMQKRIFAPHVETIVARFQPRGKLDYLAVLDGKLEPETMPAVAEYRNSLKWTLCMMSDTLLGKWLRYNSSVKFSDEELADELQRLLKLAETLPVLLDYMESSRCLTYEDFLEWKEQPRFYQPGEQS